MKKMWIFYGVVAVIVIGILGYWGYKSNVGKPVGSTGPQVAGESTISANEPYFSDTAKVTEYYQETCEWCIKESPVLTQLSSEGYRVKPVDIGANHPENQKYWTTNGGPVSGTPTFVAANGDKFEGYHDYADLKAWLDNHK